MRQAGGEGGTGASPAPLEAGAARLGQDPPAGAKHGAGQVMLDWTSASSAAWAILAALSGSAAICIWRLT